LRYPVRDWPRQNNVKLPLLCLATTALLAGQVPRIGQIEYYGLHKITSERLQRVLNLKAGDPLPPSKGDLEDQLEAVPGVVQALLEAVCCEDGKAVLFVGIEEKGAPHFAFRSEPAGEAVLPPDLVELYRKYVDAVQTAAHRGSTAEDLTEGHPLMADPGVRALQEQFVTIAKERLPVIRDVLRNAPEAEERATAAALIGYAPDKKAVLDDLQYALQDPEEGVRANAVRAMTAIAVLAARKPDLEIRIQSTWFIEMLNSVVLSDSTRAAAALVSLTEKEATGALEQIRERGLTALVEMARWRTLSYALPAYILIGRMAGLSEREIHETWTEGDRESVIRKTLQSPGKK
jgi:hypothetical protein